MAGVGCTRALARAHISRRIDATARPVAARAAAGPAVLYRRAVDVCTLFAPARCRSVSPFSVAVRTALPAAMYAASSYAQNCCGAAAAEEGA